MSGWWDHNYRYRIPVTLVDTLGQRRHNEPVKLNLAFDLAKPRAESIRVINGAGGEIVSQVINARVEDGRLLSGTVVFVCTTTDRETGFHVYFDTEFGSAADYNGIRRLKTSLADGYRRLDTGAYVLEICRGTGQGSGASKWGIRYFENKDQEINLIHGCGNAFGGVYGPFFTPENGLVNPPAHMVINIDPVDEGPILCRYKLHGTIPNGLNPDLNDKRLEMWWTFYHNSPWFERTYILDPYETVIDRRPVSNRMTVGDEIESGKGNLLLSTYKHYGGTAYRAGDLYAGILLDCVNQLCKDHPDETAAALEQLSIDIEQDPSTWHWDNYWRLFCVIEDALPRDILTAQLKSIVETANRIVWSDPAHTFVHYSGDFIEVNAMPDQTIFPTDARKTCAYSPETGYSFLYCVNSTIPRMQIVQRQDSGWVNWGTNGENEYPELLSGSTIWSAYGRFDDWEAEVDKIENGLAYRLGDVEHRGR